MAQAAMIVTGASRGLGVAIAQAAGQLGANVVLAARSLQPLQVVVEKIRDAGGSAFAVQSDLSQAEDCHRLIQQALDHFGGIEALVNNAGVIEPMTRVADADLQAWEDNWSINFFTPLRLSQLALPHLRQSHGRLINITSGASAAVIQGWGAYSTAKAAIDHLTRILAQEEPDITALSVRPGILDTAMQAAIREKGRAAMTSADYNRLSGLYQQSKLIPPERPGKAIAVLALYAPHAWSGEVIQWDDARVQDLVNSL